MTNPVPCSLTAGRYLRCVGILDHRRSTCRIRSHLCRLYRIRGMARGQVVDFDPPPQISRPRHSIVGSAIRLRCHLLFSHLLHPYLCVHFARRSHRLCRSRSFLPRRFPNRSRLFSFAVGSSNAADHSPEHVERHCGRLDLLEVSRLSNGGIAQS